MSISSGWQCPHCMAFVPAGSSHSCYVGGYETSPGGHNITTYGKVDYDPQVTELAALRARLAAATRRATAAETELAALRSEMARLRAIEAEAKHWLAEEPDPTGWILLKASHLNAMRAAMEARE